MYYHGSQEVLKNLNIITAATGVGESTVVVNGELDTGATGFVYELFDTKPAPATYGETTSSGVFVIDAKTKTVVLGSGVISSAKYIRVYEVNGEQIIGYGDALLNIG